MGTIVKERYTAIPMAANSTFTSNFKDGIGGFLASVAGTITIVQNTDTNTAVTVVNAVPVAVGFNRIPVFLGTYGGTVTLAGGAAGSLLV